MPHNQGKAIIEKNSDGGGLLIMMPDGEIKSAGTPLEAFKIVRKWARQEADKARREEPINLLHVEWRGVMPPRIQQ